MDPKHNSNVVITLIVLTVIFITVMIIVVMVITVMIITVMIITVMVITVMVITMMVITVIVMSVLDWTLSRKYCCRCCRKHATDNVSGLFYIKKHLFSFDVKNGP